MATEANDHQETHVTAEPGTETTATTTGTETTGTGLDSNVAGALAYLFGIVTGLIFYFVEKEDQFVRFHAAQSIVISAGLFVVWIALTIVSLVVGFALGGFIGGIVSLLFTLVGLALSLGAFGLWVYMMYTAYQSKTVRLPVVAGIADSLV